MSLALLSLAFAVLIGIAALWGRGQPPSLAVERLRLSDCAPPCWMGIVAGQTPAGEALRKFAEAFAQPFDSSPVSEANVLAGSYFFELSLSPVGAGASVQLDYAGGLASRVMVTANLDSGMDAMPTIGDVINAFGLPSCVAPNAEAFSGWWLFYSHAEWCD